jgi:putative IMPACT (imprinted ancient) family translation regulator
MPGDSVMVMFCIKVCNATHNVFCLLTYNLYADNDDDGETAAGGRLAHLLQILELDDVLVVVTRYFGGIHLGPDRFKHINQAARNALELSGFLDMTDVKKPAAGKGKRR